MIDRALKSLLQFAQIFIFSDKIVTKDNVDVLRIRKYIFKLHFIKYSTFSYVIFTDIPGQNYFITMLINWFMVYTLMYSASLLVIIIMQVQNNTTT